MIYEHKKTKELVDLIASGPGWCCIVKLKGDNNYDKSDGTIIKGSKKDFKKFYQKVSPKKIAKNNLKEVPELLRKEVSEQVKYDIFSILHELDSYIEYRGKLDELYAQ